MNSFHFYVWRKKLNGHCSFSSYFKALSWFNLFPSVRFTINVALASVKCPSLHISDDKLLSFYSKRILKWENIITFYWRLLGWRLSLRFHASWPSCWAYYYRFGGFEVQLPGRSNCTQCRQLLTTAAMFLRAGLPKALNRGDGSRHSLHASA